MNDPRSERLTIRKRYMHLIEEILKANPTMCEYMGPSLSAWQAIAIAVVLNLGKAAAWAAMKEWGRPKSEITRLVFCTTSGIDRPGVDYQLFKLLSLPLSVKHFMLYQQGCFSGGMVLRLAMDLAKNKCGACMLVICSEMTAINFRGPSEDHLNSMIGQTLFGDGAAALIVGSDPILSLSSRFFRHITRGTCSLPKKLVGYLYRI